MRKTEHMTVEERLQLLEDKTHTIEQALRLIIRRDEELKRLFCYHCLGLSTQTRAYETEHFDRFPSFYTVYLCDDHAEESDKNEE